MDGVLKNKYLYTLQVSVSLTSDESALLEKYKGWNTPIKVLSDNTLVNGPITISTKSLSEKSISWSSTDSIYIILTDIPDIIGTDIKKRIGEYRFREKWGVTEVKEQIKVET